MVLPDAHERDGDRAHFQDRVRLHGEEGGRPQHEIGEFAGLDRTQMLGRALRDRRIDRELGEIALHAHVVVVTRLFRKPAALNAHRFCEQQAAVPTYGPTSLRDPLLIRSPIPARPNTLPSERDLGIAVQLDFESPRGARAVEEDRLLRYPVEPAGLVTVARAYSPTWMSTDSMSPPVRPLRC
jgi:hypothetical protein